MTNLRGRPRAIRNDKYPVPCHLSSQPSPVKKDTNDDDNDDNASIETIVREEEPEPVYHCDDSDDEGVTKEAPTLPSQISIDLPSGTFIVDTTPFPNRRSTRPHQKSRRLASLHEQMEEEAAEREQRAAERRKGGRAMASQP